MLSRARHHRAILSSWLRDERAVASLEFSIIAPIMFTLSFGAYDLLNASLVSSQVYAAAHAIAVSASSLAVQADSSTSLTVTNVQQSLSAVFAEVPLIRSNAPIGVKSATLTSIAWVKNVSTCTDSISTPCAYTPYVAWSVPYADPVGRYANNANTFQSTTRACGAQNQVSASQLVSGDLTSLPTLGVTNPDPLLVVDVHYRYQPILIGFFLKSSIDFWASAIWPVRSIKPGTTIATQYTTYDLANQNSGVGKCSGF